MPGKRSLTHETIRSTIAGSGAASASGSTSGPAWCTPAFRPWTGSWSEYIAWPPVSAFRSAIAGGGAPAARLGCRIRRDRDEPVQTQESRVELLPAGVRLLREADPRRVWIGDAEDARASMA